MTNDVREQPERAEAPVYHRAAVVADSVSDDDRSVEVIASTEDIDRHGTILRANWRLDNFRENPIVLFAHNARELPIGTASEVRVVDKELRAKITFHGADLNPQAEQVWRNVKAKAVRGVSVGFWPHTITVERHNDVDVLVLDDVELLELSIVPVPSNPMALAQMRARAFEQRDPPAPKPAPANEPAPDPEPPAPTPESPPVAPESQPESPPANPEKTNMSNENKTNDATPSVARALGLPAGSSEADIVAAATRCRELELQIIAISGVPTSGEALGAVRGLKAAADASGKLAEELAKVKAERDQQNFDALIMRGQSTPVKLNGETVKHYQERFTKAKVDGRASDVVADLEGFLKVAPTITPLRYTPPVGTKSAQESSGLAWGGRSYAELKPVERARLAKEDPDLFRLMKQDHDAAQSTN